MQEEVLSASAGCPVGLLVQVWCLCWGLVDEHRPGRTPAPAALAGEARRVLSPTWPDPWASRLDFPGLLSDACQGQPWSAAPGRLGTALLTTRCISIWTSDTRTKGVKSSTLHRCLVVSEPPAIFPPPDTSPRALLSCHLVTSCRKQKKEDPPNA